MTPAAFLSTLWPDDLPGHFYLWTTPDRKTYSFDNVADAAERALQCNGHDVYFGLGLSPRALGGSERTKSEEVTAISCLWADVDVAGPGHKKSGLFASRDDVVAWARKLPILPSIAVWSGGGFHLYWLFKEPAEVGDYDLAGLVRGWENYLKSTTDKEVDTVSDLARVLRVPGTLNHKNGGAVPVEVVFSADERRYNPDDFEDYLVEEVEADADQGALLALTGNLSEDKAIKGLGVYKAPIGLELAELRAELWLLGAKWFDGGYQDWIDVMFCVHHETGGSAEGLELWSEWSAQSMGRYCGDKAALAHWKSVRGYERGGRLLTWGSARKWIEQDKAKGAAVAAVVADDGKVSRFKESLAKCSDKASVMRLIENVRLGADVSWEVEKPIQVRLKALVGSAPPLPVVRKWLAVESSSGGELSALPEWAEGWCYLRHEGLFFNQGTGERIKERPFNLAMLAHTGDDGAASDMLMGAGVLRSYWNAIYLPGAGTEFTLEGLDCVNLWAGKLELPDEEAVDKGKVELILDHAKRRFPDDWRILIDYLAWCVQNPGGKAKWCPVVQGVQGDGKSFWMRLMTLVLGERNTQDVNPVEVMSNFTDWAIGAQFAVIDEIYISGHNRFETIGKVKTYITNDRVRVVPKGGRGYNAPNVTNYLLLTNHKDALPLDDTDRRYAVLFSKVQQREQLEERSYFDRLYDYALMADAGLSARWLLMTWQVSDEFSPECPPAATAAKAEMLELVKNDVRIALEEYIEGLANKRSIVASTAFRTLNNPLSEYHCPASATKIGRELSGLGYELTRPWVNGKQVRTWTREVVTGCDGLLF